MSESHLLVTRATRKGNRIILHNRTIRVVCGRQIANHDDVVRLPVRGWRKESYATHAERAALLLERAR